MDYEDSLGKVKINVDGEEIEAVAASFRGVPFFVKDNQETGHGRTVQTHKIPLSDSWINEDLGGQVPGITLDIFLVGSTCDAQASQLKAACDKEGLSSLIHPWLGSFDVRCTDLKLGYGTSQLGYIRGTITFVNESVLPERSVSVSLRSAAKADAVKFMDSACAAFSMVFKVAGAASNVLKKAVEFTERVLYSIETSRVSLYAAQDFVSEIGHIKANVEVLLMVPGDFANRVKNLVTATAEMFGLDVDKKQDSAEYLNLLNSSVEAPENESVLEEHIRKLIMKLSLSMVLYSVVDSEFESVEDALEFQNEVSDTFDKVLEGVSDIGDYLDISNMQANALGYLRESMANMAVVVEKPLDVSTNILSFAYDTYGDVDRVEEILNRNGFSQGMFLPIGAVKVLSK